MPLILMIDLQLMVCYFPIHAQNMRELKENKHNTLL
jgi:hypothetical protein